MQIYALFITHIFRHGLLHQHAPKKFKYGKRFLGWEFGIDSGNIPETIQRKGHLVWQDTSLKIDMRLFFNDVISSIDIFIALIEAKDRNINFKKIRLAYSSQYKPLLRKDLEMRSKNHGAPKDLDFLKKF